MLRTRVLLALAALLIPLAIVVPASATVSAPTLTGPATVPYYASVTLSGTTPQPNEAVTVYLLRTVGTNHNTYPLTSDATGHFHLTYRATLDWKWFAYAGGQRSPEGTTNLVTATCTVSGPLFTKLPFTPQVDDHDDPAFAAFSVELDGLWAGVEVDGLGNFAAISWRSGQAPKILGKWSYLNGRPYEPGEPGGYSHSSVEAVGITPSGGIVVSVEVPSENSRVTNVGYVYLGGKRSGLDAPVAATSVDPVAVTDDGHIVGLATVGTGRSAQVYVERWDGTGSHRETVLRVASGQPDIVVDGAGDIAYYPTNGTNAVRLNATGMSVPIDSAGDVYPGSAYIYGSGGASTFYGDSDAQLVSWDASSGGSSVPIVSTLAGSQYDISRLRASRVGDVLIGTLPGRRYYRTHTGALVKMPLELSVDIGFPPASVVAPGGGVAFTSATDKRVHLMTCH